jgi:SOS-response transcriptional repressor LexA
MLVKNKTPAPRPTPRQGQLLEAIERLTREGNGLPPSLRELADDLGIHWTSAAELAAGCRARGLLTWSPRSPRTYRVMKPTT